MSEIVKAHKGIVTKGKFIPDDSLSFKMGFCKHEGKRVAVTVKRETKKRSLNQNDYYWVVVIELIRESLGYTAQEMHEALKWQLLRVVKGKYETVKSTSDLTTIEMEEYLEGCRRIGSECGIYVPLPNEVGY
jgi:hypothetical protein